MSTNEDKLNQKWESSRSGAWAARGFHFQHLITALILIRQWAGLYPAGHCVPEGLDDCVLEFPNSKHWIQIKSRASGAFTKSEVRKIFDKIHSGIAEIREGNSAITGSVILQQKCNSLDESSIQDLFSIEGEPVFVCENPDSEIIDLIKERLKTADVIAEGIANDLYRMVADAATENAALDYTERRRISTTEVERKINLRLEAEDPALLDEALRSGALMTVDFTTPISDSNFYQGIKAKLGHVASGQVIKRPTEVDQISKKLKTSRQLLISGPSGAGKSSLLWLSANALCSQGRWFEVSQTAIFPDAHSIIRFIGSRHPKPHSPVFLAMDEVASQNHDLWGLLSSSLSNLPHVYLLGTIRVEDLHLVPNRSEIETFTVTLDESLAESVWSKFHSNKTTTWSHWREPFEMSNGLFLEYTHILTQGKRLSSVIAEQIRLREKEDRNIELSIIRICSTVSCFGGEVSVKKLLSSLDISPAEGKKALTRLLDEHLIHESADGIIGGLHRIRSNALCHESHDNLVYLKIDSLLKGIGCVTTDSKPRVIRLALADNNKTEVSSLLRGLADTLSNTTEVATWTSIFTGLGLATLEQNVSLFIATLRDVKLAQAHWSLASMFMDAKTNFPSIPGQENFVKIEEGLSNFRSAVKPDLRATCLNLLPTDHSMPQCNTVREANALLASLLPIPGCSPIENVWTNFKYNFSDTSCQSIYDISSLLATARLIDIGLATEISEHLGGEKELLSLVESQLPWTKTPSIETNDEGERTVRADWFLVAEGHQSNPHEAICEVCEILIGISPESQFAASEVINCIGDAVDIDGYASWSKRMPHGNLPAKARVAWNVVFNELVKFRTSHSLTDYVEQMSGHVRTVEQIFRDFTETWIRGKKTELTNPQINEINDTIYAINSLSYSQIEETPTNVVSPSSIRSKEDRLGGLLTGILGNLLGRICKASSGDGTKATATYAGGLHGDTSEHLKSDIWRVTDEPPKDELNQIKIRLKEVSDILHEFDYDCSEKPLAALIKAAKKAPLNKGISVIAKRCNQRAEKRLNDELRSIRKHLSSIGWRAFHTTRSIEKGDSVYWPPLEVSVLVEIPNSLSEQRDWMECLEVCGATLRQPRKFSLVPIMNHKILSSLAITPSSNALGFLPDLNFNSKWQSYSGHEFAPTRIASFFDATILSCIQMSSIGCCRDSETIHPKEEETCLKIGDDLKKNTNHLVQLADSGQFDECPEALSFIKETREALLTELQNDTPSTRLCEQYYDSTSQWNLRYIEIKTALLIVECSSESHEGLSN